MEKKIWVLGSKHEKADKSILWHESFPNFVNSDILIVNLQSLTEDIYGRNVSKLREEGQKYIFDLLMAQIKEAIFILNSNEKLLRWLPAYPIVRKIARADIGEYVIEPHLEDFLEQVLDCDYYIHDIDAGFFRRKTDPKSREHENYFFTGRASTYYSLGFYIENEIENQAKQKIGCGVKVVITYGRDFEKFYSGKMYFLPPPTKVASEQGIDLIINNLVGAKLKESPPNWENRIDLPNLRDLEQQISQREKRKEELITEIENLEIAKRDKIKFRRLLWTKDTPLEDVVRDAFEFLGFPEIRKIRERNLEDWVIEFRSIPDYQFGVFEIKGADKRTALSDLTQCNKWVEDYMLDGKKAKGIFVPNQYRLENIKESKEKREHFEPNELDYAEKREICILPSHEIFRAIKEKMKKNPEITRENIEQKIASAKGLCKLI